MKRIYVTDSIFGARNDGSGDNAAAFAAAAGFIALASASGCHHELIFPAGVYAYSVSPNWAIPFASYHAEGEARLQYSGTGSAWIMDGGATGGGVCGVRMDGGFIIGGSAKSGDGIWIRACHHSDITARVNGCGVNSTAIRLIFCVCTRLQPIVSNNEGWYQGAAPATGIYFGVRNAGEVTSYCRIDNPVIEGVGQGAVVDYALGCMFEGGTMEGCSQRGLNITGNALGNKFTGVDFEANAIQDIYCQGRCNEFDRCDSNTQITIDAPSLRTTIKGGQINNVTIVSGAIGTLLDGVRYNRNGTGGISDSGTVSRQINCWNMATGAWSS